MSNTNASVSVTFTYNSGNNPPDSFSYGPNQNPLKIKANTATITWTLSANSTSGVTWPTTGGVVFTPGWTNAGNSQPTYDATANSYSVTDNNNVSATITYDYTIKVMYGGNSYSTDPDVTNSPP